jgi:DNA polymerase I-like protein with 3'-5' exonuclease and polymerase domains
MPRYIFDIETDGLLDTVSKVHSLVLKDADTGATISCANNQNLFPTIESGIDTLKNADEIIGHNIICFDLPVLERLYGFTPACKVTDTLVLSRLLWADIKNMDMETWKKNPGKFPGKLIGSHSLKAWGYRLGILKDTFGETTDWAEWSEEMQEYCEQDTAVTLALFKRINAIGYSEEAGRLEHEFQRIIFKQEETGVCFDKEKAGMLHGMLMERLLTVEARLTAVFPPIDEGEWFTPKANNRTKGWTKGVPIWKEKIVPFNPSSRDHIIKRLQLKYNWMPEEYTNNGKPKIDDEVLQKLPYDEAPLLSEYLLLQKRIGQLATGNQAWLRLVGSDGRIHGRVNTNGAVTGRCTHHNPNLAQVPAVGAPYGTECRELFYAPEGYSMVGADASGLELRCLSHYLTRYDGGAYRDIVLHGDIHTENQKAAGLATRAEAKRFI